MDQGLSMAARREITKRFAAEYARASKKDKGRILDELVGVTDWSRANARRALSTALKRKGPAKPVKRQPRPRTYGYDTLKVLIEVWRKAGMPSGKYLAATMDLWLPKLEALGELEEHARLSPEVKYQLFNISPATIDRMLRPTRAAMEPKGLSATTSGPLLRSSITVRKAGDEHEQEPGFVEVDLVAHCGPALVGEFAWTLTATDVFTGWTENIAIRNKAAKWILQAMDTVTDRLPFPLVGLHCDNGGEFINHALIDWAGDRDIYFTRARPYHSNDNAHVEQKNGDVVRRHAFHYRYDTALELQLLNELFELVRIRLNMFTATTKAIGWRENKHGKKTRVYDKPRTPYQRLTDSGTLSPAQTEELNEQFHATNPAALTRGINAIQRKLITIAAEKTKAITTTDTRAKTDEARTHISRAS
jgi:transposase InsO family protein